MDLKGRGVCPAAALAGFPTEHLPVQGIPSPSAFGMLTLCLGFLLGVALVARSSCLGPSRPAHAALQVSEPKNISRITLMLSPNRSEAKVTVCAAGHLLLAGKGGHSLDTAVGMQAHCNLKDGRAHRWGAWGKVPGEGLRMKPTLTNVHDTGG